MSNIPEIERLKRKWKKLTGEDMPTEIASQDIAVVRSAVEKTANDDHVFVPVSRPTESKDGYGYGSSMREWDSDSFY